MNTYYIQCLLADQPADQALQASGGLQKTKEGSAYLHQTFEHISASQALALMLCGALQVCFMPCQMLVSQYTHACYVGK